MNIINSSADMKLKPNKTSPLLTQGLFGEKVDVLDNYNEWLFCKLHTDNYCGWIKQKNLDELDQPTHRVISPRTCILAQKDVKSNFINYLPLGSQLHVVKIEENWAEILLSKKHFYKTGYVPNKHLIKINDIVKDWIAIAEQLIGTPYKYGGRDSIALDSGN